MKNFSGKIFLLKHDKITSIWTKVTRNVYSEDISLNLNNNIEQLKKIFLRGGKYL